MTTRCPYCTEEFKVGSRDHIFPEFLGGRRTITACRRCNSTYGHSFEAKASCTLQGLHVSISSWGLPLQGPTPIWKNSHCYDGKPFDLYADGEFVKLQLARATPVKNGKGDTEGVYYPTLREAQKAVRQARRKGRGATVEVETHELPFTGARFRIELRREEYRAALKMCLALATLMRDHSSADIARARADLAKLEGARSASGVQPCFRVFPSLEALRPSLSHTVYVERSSSWVYGVVQFFGVIQLVAVLGENRSSAPEAAAFGFLDPLTGDEVFKDRLAPLRLAVGPGLQEHEIRPGMQSWINLFREAAIDRGAKSPPNLSGELSYGAY